MTKRSAEEWADRMLSLAGDERTAAIEEIRADARNATLEAAAEAADDHRGNCGVHCGGWDGAVCDAAIAAAIRALKNPADGS